MQAIAISQFHACHLLELSACASGLDGLRRHAGPRSRLVRGRKFCSSTQGPRESCS